jgi:putative protein-disulfide isomerase
MTNAAPHLIYFADPMCSWCWGFAPVIAGIRQQFGARLPIRLVLGGLRPGTTEPLDEKRKDSLRTHWHHVHEASGQPFSQAFFARDGFVYDTDPACRAVVVARRHGMDLALAMLHRLQAAFYAENRDITQAAELAAIAVELGLERATFESAFATDEIRAETWQDYATSQRTGVTGFPTLIAGSGRDQAYALVTQGFDQAARILPALDQWLASQQADAGQA